MKPMTFVVALVSALSVAGPAYASQYAACEGLEGKDLKKCEKAEAKKAKQDSRSEPLLPSQVDAKLSSYDANNPFATDAYRVRVTPTGIQVVDDYLVKTAEIKGTVVFARYVVDNATNGELNIQETGPLVLELLAQIPEKGKSLVDEGKKLADPNQLKGLLENPADILKVPKLVPAINDALTNVTSSLKEVPAVLDSLKSIVN